MTGGTVAVVKLKYVMRDRDRHGRVRYYFRRVGRPKVLLNGEPGSEEFARSYHDALSGIGGRAKTLPPASPKSLRWLCQMYYGSAEYKGLAARTKHVRRLILDHFCREHGDAPYASLEAPHVRYFRDQKADKPEAANSLVKALRQVYAYALGMEWVKANPCAAVPYIVTGSQGHHAWTVEEVRKYEARHPIGTKARLAMALLLYTGQRRSDIVTFGKQHIRDMGNWKALRFLVVKNQSRKPKQMEVPLLSELEGIIASTPSTGLAFLETEHGQPFTSNGFGNAFRRWCDQAGLSNCSAHGLRKAGATIAAENGATAHALMAIFGWETLKEANRYTRTADQRRLASEHMHLILPGQDGNESAQPLAPRKSGRANRGKK